MKVVWTEEAQAHLDGIHRYIERDAPFYAKQVVDKLTRRSEQLIAHPRSGRIVPKYDNPELRELIVFPYRLVYRLKPDRMDVPPASPGAKHFPASLYPPVPWARPPSRLQHPMQEAGRAAR